MNVISVNQTVQIYRLVCPVAVRMCLEKPFSPNTVYLSHNKRFRQRISVTLQTDASGELLYLRHAGAIQTYKPKREQIYLLTSAHNENSNQTAHPRSLI